MTRTLVRKTCDILIALRGPSMTRMELSERTKIPKSSLNWMLDDLVDMGLVERHRRKQEFGMGSPPYRYRVADGWKTKEQ